MQILKGYTSHRLSQEINKSVSSLNFSRSEGSRSACQIWVLYSGLGILCSSYLKFGISHCVVFFLSPTLILFFNMEEMEGATFDLITFKR